MRIKGELDMNQTRKFNPNQPNSDRAALSAIIVVLEMMAAQLKDIDSDVRSSVDGVCAGFAGMGSRAKSALSSSSEALDSSIDGGGLKAFVHRVKIALEVLLNRIESVRKWDDVIMRDISDSLQRLALVDELSKKMIDVGARATAAVPQTRYDDLSPREQRQQFQKMREQVSILSYAATEAGTAIADVYAGVHASLDRCNSRIKQKRLDDEQVAGTSQLRVKDLLEKMTATYERMSESLASSAQMSRQLNNDISQAVVSMQFQDRVTQRMDHLLDTIDDLMVDLRPYADAGTNEETPSLTEFWIQRINEKATMDAERQFGDDTQASQGSSSDDDDDIELF